MLNAQFRPLDKWPGERTPWKTRKSATFRSKWLQTLDLLEYELGKLKAQHAVIQIEDPEAISGLRNDGSIRILSQKFWKDKSGVVLTFESPKGDMSMPCDRYDYWQDNLRAIALSLEALRAVDRYGVTRGNEQYRGWSKLEAPGAKNGKMDRGAAIRFLAGLHKSPPENLERLNAEQLRDICRTARIENHPDRGGSHETFVAIGQAEAVLCGAIQ